MSTFYCYTDLLSHLGEKRERETDAGRHSQRPSETVRDRERERERETERLRD